MQPSHPLTRVTLSRTAIAWGDIADSQRDSSSNFPREDSWRILLPVFPAESIVGVACAAAHLLFVTSFGNVYSCGDNAEGALGHGDRSNRASPVPVAYFEEAGVRVKAAMAGRGLIGAHSACVSEAGELFCWGVGAACGVGRMEDQLTPQMVELVEQLEEEDAEEEEREEGKEGDEVVDTKVAWKTAACGGGFTVGITTDGRVYSWGMWARGRLGLGEPEQLLDENPGKRKVPRFRLFPQQIEFSEEAAEGTAEAERKNITAVEVACGDAHTLLVDSDQQIWSWGSNTMGQLGVGLDDGQSLADVLSPMLVRPFVMYGNSDDKHSVRAQQVACGVSHSLVIDTNGSIWTWGARGRACLGHNDSLTPAFNVQRKSSFLTTEVVFHKHHADESNPPEVLEWVKSWSTPRRVPTLNELKFTSIDGGEQHTVATTTDGRIYSWGDGVAIMQSPQAQLDSDEPGAAPIIPRLNGLPVPRQRTRTWLPGLSAVHASWVKCAGRFSISVAEGDAIAHRLTLPLYECSIRALTDLTSAQLTTFEQKEEQPIRAVLCANGRLDCALLVQGKVLFAHRVMLGKRSALFRELLIAEAPLQDDELTRILLADIHYDVARALLEFIYTDTVSLGMMALPAMADNLLRAAKQFKLPKLQHFCEQWLVMDRALAVSKGDDDDDDAADDDDAEATGEDESEAETSQTTQPESNQGTTLAADLSELVDDMEYADVCFYTSNSTSIYAHMFILEARSSYFKQLFQDVPLEDTLSPGGRVSIVVPDSRESMLRLLAFMYTLQLVDTSHEALTEGMVIADRYKVEDMKLACANAIVPTTNNLIETLTLLQRIEAPSLYERIVHFITSNLPLITQDPKLFDALKSNFPETVRRVHEHRHRCDVVLAAPMFNDTPTPKEEELLGANAKIPWATITVAILCVIFYRQLIRVVAIGYVVPVVNVLTLVGVSYYIFQQLKS